VHPVVVFSILDHYKRRQQDQHRVVGALLGEKKAERVYITNSFAVLVPQETEDSVTVNFDSFDNMLSLHKKVYPNEQTVGWYSTGGAPGWISSLIQKEFAKRMSIKGFSAMHLTVDVDAIAKTHSLNITAYTAVPLENNADMLYEFTVCPLEYESYDTEKIGVDALIFGSPLSSKLDAPASLLDDFENLEMSVNKLVDILEILIKYTKSAADGKVKGDPLVAAAITTALASVPNVDPATFQSMFNAQIKDLLMVMYLSNLTRTQLALADKIIGVFQP